VLLQRIRRLCWWIVDFGDGLARWPLRSRNSPIDKPEEIVEAFSLPQTRDADQSRSILVTGMPRSGTTWLARLLATAQGTALTGREPMNPRGRQYALGRTLPGWVRMQSPSLQQRWALQSAYRGLNPWVYSRYGRRQWAAPLPWTRLVVKDPFAMLSVPAVVRTTGTAAVLVYRHPGAALASYRRMGWQPDLAELQPVVRAHQQEVPFRDPRADDLPLPGEVSEPEAMGRFWSALYAMALSDVGDCPQLIVVSHEELAGGGASAAHALFEVLGLRWTGRSDIELASESGRRTEGASMGTELHNFNRDPAKVAMSWRNLVTETEIELIESVTGRVRARLDQVRIPLI